MQYEVIVTLGSPAGQVILQLVENTPFMAFAQGQYVYVQNQPRFITQVHHQMLGNAKDPTQHLHRVILVT